MLSSLGKKQSEQEQLLVPTRPKTRPTKMQSSSRLSAITACAHTGCRQKTLLQTASTSMHNRALNLQTWVVSRRQVAREELQAPVAEEATPHDEAPFHIL